MYKVRAVFLAASFAAASGLSGALLGAAPARAENCPGNPNALGTSRVLVVSPSEYHQLGSMQYTQTLPLADKEVVLTFDDGPLPPWSNKVLDILNAQCVKATYFIVGGMAKYFPDVVRRELASGDTIGTHSQDHPIRFEKLTGDKLNYQIDAGIASVGVALGDPNEVAPFFRIPGLGRSPAVEDALAERSLVVFSADVVADDWFRHITPAQIVQRAMSRLEKHGGGILLLHDIHPWTAAALPELLKQLKENGFHIVQVVPAAPGTPAAPLVAGTPKLLTLASAAPEPGLIDEGSAGPVWPEGKANLAPDDDGIMLPAPDEAAFNVDYPLGPGDDLANETTASAEWPDLPEIAPPTRTAELPAPGLTDIGVSLHGQKLVGATDLGLRPSLDVPAANEHERPRHVQFREHAREHLHARRPGRARAAIEGQHAELPAPLPSETAQVAPAY
jgi:peptidoglycan/xylan/chitin deacetylase (PgdA/CDA1 family)